MTLERFLFLLGVFKDIPRSSEYAIRTSRHSGGLLNSQREESQNGWGDEQEGRVSIAQWMRNTRCKTREVRRIEVAGAQVVVAQDFGD
jgi:hypothetical protein